MNFSVKQIIASACVLGAITVLSACGSSGGDSPPSQSSASSSGSSIAVTNAPASVNGYLVPNLSTPQATITNGSLGVAWNEQANTHSETLGFKVNLTSGSILLAYSLLDGSVSNFWGCDDQIGVAGNCGATTVDINTGRVIFNNQVLIAANGAAVGPITLNGSLNFIPPAGISPNPGGGGSVAGNNRALLTGAVIGKGISATGDLRKSLTVTDLSANAEFSIGTAYATRPTTTLDYAYTFVPVTNNGSQTQCFVVLKNITYRDLNDTPISTGGISYIDGSVAAVSATIFTDTCLAPGETGLAAGVIANIYGASAKMEFTLESQAINATAPAARVIPQSYSLTDPTATTYAATLLVSVKNVGIGSALVGAATRFHSWYLLDATDQPLMYGLTDKVAQSVTPVNTTTTISADVFYDGVGGDKVLVFVNYEDTTLATNQIQAIANSQTAADICPESLPTEDLTLCRINSRNSMLENLQSDFNAQNIQ